LGGDERENLHDNGPIPAFASREFSQHKKQQFHFVAAEAAAIKHRSFVFRLLLLLLLFDVF
jgi:hypothetical protein